MTGKRAQETAFMIEHTRPTSIVPMHPIHAMLLPFPFVCFVGTLATDLAYWQSANTEWETFSVWLLAVGLVMAGFGVVAGWIDFFGHRRARTLAPSWQQFIGTALVIILSLINVFVHSRDGYTAVVPTGITLSAIVVVILLVNGWNGWTMTYRHSYEVTN